MYQFVRKVFMLGTDNSYILYPSYNTLEEAEEFIQSLNPEEEVLNFPECKGVIALRKSEQSCYFIKGYKVVPSSKELKDDTSQLVKRIEECGMYYLFKLAD